MVGGELPLRLLESFGIVIVEKRSEKEPQNNGLKLQRRGRETLPRLALAVAWQA